MGNIFQATHRHPSGKLYKLDANKWQGWDDTRHIWYNVLLTKSTRALLTSWPEKDMNLLEQPNKYKHRITVCNGVPVNVDVYDVLRAWNITDPAHAHGLKKILQPGTRGAKDLEQDLEEGIKSLQMYLQYVEQDVAGN